MAYKQYQEGEWNTWNTISGQITDDLDSEYPNYSIDFNYTKHPKISNSNLFEGMCACYDKRSTLVKYHTQIEKAVSYGYRLGEYMFKGCDQMIYDFLDNLPHINEEQLDELPDSMLFKFTPKCISLEYNNCVFKTYN